MDVFPGNPGYSVAGADAKLTESLKDVWGKYDEAKAVLQRIDHRIQQHEAPTNSDLNSSLREKTHTSSKGKSKMQVSKSYGHKVAFKEPLVSYHEKHDPKSSILGSSQTVKYPDAATLSYSARDFNTTDYDSLRVSLRNFDPSADNPRLYPDSSNPNNIANSYDIKNTSPTPESPKDQLVPVRELNKETYFEPSGKLVKPGKNLSTAGVAQTIVNPFSVDSYIKDSVERDLLSNANFSTNTPKKRYNAAKQKKKLEENSEGLAKLKETIRKQKENRSPSSLHGTPGLKFYHKSDDPIQPIPYNMDITKPLVRKIAAGPAAPKYKGFNTAETRLRTPDGKVWKEDGTISMQSKVPQAHRKTKTALFQDGPSGVRSRSLDRTSTNKHSTKGKATRKIGKIKSDQPSHKKTLITPSSWREGQKVAEAILGPISKQKKTLASGVAMHSPPTKDVARKDPQAAETAQISCNNNNATASAATNSPNMGQEISALLNQDDLNPEKDNDVHDSQFPDAQETEEPAVLSVNMKEMLSDLKSSDSSSNSDTEVEKGNKDLKKRKKSPKLNKKRKPTSAKETPRENSEPIRKVRHYNQTQVQKYMAKQKAERRKKEVELKKQERQANERKIQQLNNLDKRQKEARKKTVQDDGKMKSSLQNTFTKVPPSGPNSSRSANTDHAGIGYESRVASFLDKLDRYRHTKQSDDGKNLELQPGGTKVSDFMSKLDQYLNEDTERTSQNKSHETRYTPGDNDEGDLTVADLSNSQHSSPLRNPTSSPHQSSPRLTAVASYSDKPDYYQMDRIAALKAKSDLLQERIDKQAKCLLEKPGDNFGNLSYYTPYENQLKSSHRSQQSLESFKSPSPTHSTNLQNRYEHETSIPGVSNLREHVAAHEQQNVENAASTTIQAAYKGYAVRHALETWELPSGNTLMQKSQSEADESHSTSSSSTSRSSETSMRSVDKIMDSLTKRDFCVDDEKKATWADKITDDDQNRSSDGRDVLQDLKSRLRPKTAPSDAQKHGGLSEINADERSKPPWQRSHGDKYSIPNLFAHKYLKALNRQQKVENPYGADLEHKRQKDADVPNSSYSRQLEISDTHPKHYAHSADDLQISLPPDEKTNDYDNDFQSMTSTGSSVHDNVEVSSSSNNSSRLGSSQTRSSFKIAGKQLRNPAELISWSKSLRQDATELQQQAETAEDGSELEVGTETNFPPVNFPAPSQGSPKYSPAVLEHKMTLELNRYESIDEAIKQLGGTERMQSVALAQQETVSLAQILQSRQLQHQLEVDRLTLKAKEEALEAARQADKLEMERRIKEAKDKEEKAQNQNKMALKLQEETLKSLKVQQKVTEATQHLFSTQKKSYKADDYTTSSEKSYSSSETSTKTPGTEHSYNTSTFDSYRQTQEIKLPAKPSVHRSPPSIVSEHSTTSVRQSDDDISIPEQIMGRGQKLPFSSSESKSISENIEAKGFDETDRSISEDIQTSEKSKFKKTDDKTKKDKPKTADSHDISDVGSVTFDESVTEDEIAEISRRAIFPSESHRRMQRRKSPLSKPPKEQDLYDHSNLSVSSDDTLPSQAGKSRLSGLEESFSGPTSLFGDSDIGSFSQFLNATVQQYMLEQEVRARHQSVMLKLREKAIKEKTQAELAWLEQQKQHVRRKGEDDKMPPIKKKKRAILLRLQVETEEIKKLRAANKAALQDRELIIKQHKDISRIMHSTQQIKEKLKSGSNSTKGTDPKAKLSLSPDPHLTSSTPVPQAVDSASVSEDDISIPNSDLEVSASNRLLRHLKLVSGGLDDRRLTYREKGLLKRKKDAERLLEWKRKLDEEEQKVIDIEKKAISAWTEEASPENALMGKSTKDDSRKIVPTSAERQLSVSPSESSIAEEVATRGVEDGSTTTSSSAHENNKPAGSQDLSSEGTIGDDYSQSFESSVQSVGKNTSNPEQSSSAPLKEGTASKKQSKPSSASSSPGPTTPLLGHKKTSTSVRIPKKRDIFDSGSDESFSQTQSETEQSDVECRVHVLQEELKRRQLIAEKLKKQQKKKRKEHLRAQEASLKTQIEAYDALIKKTKQELTQELDVSGVVTGSNGTSLTSHTVVAKPQIRSPRKSDQARQANRSRKYVIPVQSPEASPRAGSQKTVGPSSIITKQRSDSDSSGRSSRSLSFDDDQQHSPEDAINGSKPFIHPLPFATRPTDKLLHSSAESSPTAIAAQERPNKLELFGAKLAPLPTTPITSPLPSLSKQATPDKSTASIKSLIPKPSKTQSPKQKTPTSSPDVSQIDDTSKSSSLFRSSIPVPVKPSGSEKPKDDSPTTPPSGYVDDFEPSSTGTDDDVSENISEHSTDKSDMSVPLMDLSTPISTKKMELSDEDDEKTPVASPSTTPTPSPPDTPTPQNANVMLSYDEIEGVDVMDGAACVMDVRKHDFLKSETPASFGNKQLAEKVSEDILRSLVEESMNIAINARNFAGSRDVEENRRRKQKDSEAPTSTEANKRVRRNEPSSELTPSARNLLQILTDQGDENVTGNQAEPASKEQGRDDASDDITDNLLSETINEVLEIRKQRAKKWAEASFPRDYENGNEVESIMQVDGKKRVLASKVRTGLESEDVDREPTIARPVSPIFGSSQDDVSEEWFDDDMYITPYQGKKRDESPIVNLSDDWSAEDVVIGPPPIKLAVPAKCDDVMYIVNQAINFYHEKQIRGEMQENFSIPEEYLEDTDVIIDSDQPETAKSASRVFKKCIFDLVWELMAEAYGTSPNMKSQSTSPWIKMRRRKRPSFCKAVPKSKKEILTAVSDEVNKLFNFSGVRRKLDPRLTLKWGTMKKKDNVDLLLIEELREEEPDWTDYDIDETTVKMQLADNVMEFLLKDTIQCLNKIEQKKSKGDD